MGIKIVFDEEDLRCLIRGGILKIKSPSGIEVEMILTDIGFPAISRALTDAMAGKDQYEDRERVET